MSALRTLLFEHDGTVVLGQLLLWLLCLGLAAPVLLRELRRLGSRTAVLLAALGLVAAAVSFLLFPTSRFDALGHEGVYSVCFREATLNGVPSPSNQAGWHPFVTYPLLRWSYWALGGLLGRGDGFGALLLLNACARGLGVAFIGWLGCVLLRSRPAGVVAALLFAVHPVHAFWGAGIYNVAIPHAVASLCLLLAVLAWRSGEARLFAAAAVTGAMVPSMRIEWGLLGPLLAILLLGLGPGWGRHPGVKRLRFWLPALALAGTFGLLLVGLGGDLTEQGGYHGLRGYLESIGRQGSFVRVFGPWHLPWMLAATGFGLWSWSRMEGVGLRGPVALVAMFVLGHLAFATFNDYSYRHALLPGLVLPLAAAASAQRIGKPDKVSSALAILLLVAAVITSAGFLGSGLQRYYASDEAFFERAEGFEGPELSAEKLEDGSCYLVTDNERIHTIEAREAGKVGSHFNLMDPGEAVTHYRQHGGCVLWLLDNSQWRWDGLGVIVRAQKLQHWFDWEPEGWARFPDGLVAVVYRMSSPPWGIGDDEAIPESEILRPEPEAEDQEPEEENPPEVGGHEERQVQDPPGDEPAP